METSSLCETTLDDSNLAVEQSLSENNTHNDEEKEQNNTISENLIPIEENNDFSKSINKISDDIAATIQSDSVLHLEKCLSQVDINEEKEGVKVESSTSAKQQQNNIIDNKYPIVLLHQLTNSEMAQKLSSDEELKEKIEEEESFECRNDKEDISHQNSPFTTEEDIEMKDIELNTPDIIMKEEENNTSNFTLAITSTETTEIPKTLIDSESTEIKKEAFPVIQEVKEKEEKLEQEKVEFIKQEVEESSFSMEEDYSYLRRSRRLKSVYVENPIMTKVEEQTTLTETNITENPIEHSLVENTSKLEITENQIEIKKEEKYEEIDDPQFVDPNYDPRLSHFITIKDNIYSKASDKVICKINKTMKCDCTITEEDIKNGELGCTDNCINRLLFIECSPKCRCGEFCDNQQFQRHNYSPISVFRTEKKGFGIRAEADIPPETFLIEYVGEVLNNKQFEKRAAKYSKQKNRHYYFMALRSNAVIDATVKGNISRFINHSCDPNAMTQKWTINGELRVGFFSIRRIKKGEEITFDYQYQRYGKEAQKCYCESENCRGWIGENPLSDEEMETSKKVKAKKIAAAVGRKKKLVEEGIKQENDEVPDENEKPTDANITQIKPIGRKPRKVFEDLEIEDQIKDLTKSGLKNRAHTISFARLVVRAKNVEARMSLLKILIDGDLPCRRLFLDYNGLRLLHNWMCDINVKNSVPDLYLCIELIYALELLPITNKTVLRDSKVLERVEKWKNLDIEKRKLTKEEKKQAKADKKLNKLKNESVEETTPFVQTFDVLEELPTMKLVVKEKSSNLLQKWEVLKEDFRIPKKQKQEIMKEHEKEAGMDEENWNDSSTSSNHHKQPNDRFKNRFGNDSNRNSSSHYGSTSSSGVPSTSYRKYLDPLERQQRRQQFERRMAEIDHEKRMWAEHENNCAFFTLPSNTHPTNIPVQVNRVTGEYYNILGQQVPPPPNHHTFKYEPLSLSTNPDDYHLPPIDLPEQWRYAIDTYGRIYYYHEKIRQSQWEPPIKIQPLSVDDDNIEDLGEPESDESTTDTDDSEEEELRELLDLLKRKKRKFPTTELNENSLVTNDLNSIEEDLEKKIMNNMIKNPTENSIKLLPTKPNKKSRRGLVTMVKFIRPRTEQDKLYGRSESRRYKEVKEKLRRQKKKRLQQKAEGIFNDSDDEDDLEDDDDIPINESNLSKKIVDELDLLNKTKNHEKIRKIKMDVDDNNQNMKEIIITHENSGKQQQQLHQQPKKPENKPPSNTMDHVLIRRQFRDDIKEEIKKYLLPFCSDSCVNGRITTEEDYISLVNKVKKIFFILF